MTRFPGCTTLAARIRSKSSLDDCSREVHHLQRRISECAGLPTRIKRDAAKRRARTALLLLALAATALSAETTPTTPIGLTIQPPELTFGNTRDGRKLLVTAVLETGQRVDLTADAEFNTNTAPVERGDDGFLTPTGPGSGSVTVRAAGLTATIPVTVHFPGSTEPAEPVTFVRDVLPAMNKVGCSQGTCHGAAKGKNGFKLSLRGYDPEFDYQSLLYDMSGRRFNRADPARSLMLAKPTMQVAHEGGLQIEHGSRYYNLLLDWISTGVPYGDSGLDRVERLEIHPGEVFMYRPEMRQQPIVIAHYGDGRTRDVTREAHVTSSNTETIAISTLSNDAFPTRDVTREAHVTSSNTETMAISTLSNDAFPTREAWSAAPASRERRRKGPKRSGNGGHACSMK